ncbi:hypothetical protein L2E82_48719 [Cichorium intybus]|uniref:Uncharacterized protein n=1 Tax=Cichorium intybus TaxID=13427 RepID=A0ACB8Z2V5_CICIN|nr:hypothetical protein L2E82_48719 [Cichorium intybus]
MLFVLSIFFFRCRFERERLDKKRSTTDEIGIVSSTAITLFQYHLEDSNFLLPSANIKRYLTLCTHVGVGNDITLSRRKLRARNQKVNEKDKPLLSISNFVQVAPNNVLLAVPALLYAINIYLEFTMHLYFNPTTVALAPPPPS